MPGRVTLGSTLGDWLQRAGSRVMPAMLTMQELSDAKWRKQQAENERAATELWRQKQQSNWEATQKRQDEEEKARKLERYQDVTLKTLDEAGRIADEKKKYADTLAERDRQYNLDVLRENRLTEAEQALAELRRAQADRATPSTTGAVPAEQRGAVHSAWISGTRVPNPNSQTGAMMDAPWTPARADSSRTFMATGLFPAPASATMGPMGSPLAQFDKPSMSAVAPLNDPDRMGREKYEDWDTLSPEEKQMLIQAGFPD